MAVRERFTRLACCSLLGLGVAGCSATIANYHTYATAAPPGNSVQTAADTDPSVPAGSPTQASCGNDASFKNFEILRQYSVGSSQNHTNPDGSVDSSTFNFGGQTDSQGVAALSTGIASIAGMVIKGAATGGAGAAFVLAPNKDGTFRLVPVQPGPTQQMAAASPSRKWGPATASGCIPLVHAPGFDAGGQDTAPQAMSEAQPTAVVPSHPPMKQASAYVLPTSPIPMLEAFDDTTAPLPPMRKPKHPKRHRKPVPPHSSPLPIVYL
jgi:hypothetical protein